MIASSTPTTAIAIKLNSRMRLRWKITWSVFGLAARYNPADLPPFQAGENQWNLA
jgi:hypothetical protein